MGKRPTLLTVVVITCILFYGTVFALVVDPPHDAGHGTTCRNCHVSHLSLGTAGYNNICLDCHRPGVPAGGDRPFVVADLADPFGTYSAPRSGILYQTSHSWEGPDRNVSAGAEPPLFATMTAVRSRTGGRLACVRCHNQHDNTTPPFLRMSNDLDQMCRDCHRSRDRRNHTSGTHPVNFNYTGAGSPVKSSPAGYFNPPRSVNPGNPTASMALRQGSVQCTTCHGVHYTDSNSATFDNHSGYYQLRPSGGSLLRSDLRGAGPTAVNLCTQCHAGKQNHMNRGQNIQCGDCHSAHVDTGDGSVPNVWLVRRFMNVSTSYGYRVRNGTVFFQSTSVRSYKAAAGTGVCQGCHDVPTGAGYPAEHVQNDGRLCVSCHSHDNPSGAFSAIAGSCDSCHGYPPRANTSGGPRGYAAGSPFTNESSSAHVSHAGLSPYSKLCVECHQGNSHRTGTFQDLFLDTTGRIAATAGASPVFDPAATTCSSVYCHSNGAPRGGILITRTTPQWANGRRALIGTAGECGACHGDAATLATNSHSRHVAVGLSCSGCHGTTVSGNTTITDTGLHVNGQKEVAFGSPLVTGGIWTTGTATCSSVYCHSNIQGSNGLGTPTLFATPTWGGAAPGCGNCHADMVSEANPPGSHRKHAQEAGISCGACHAGLGSGSTLHVNGRIDTAFQGVANLGGTTTVYSRPAHPAGTGYGACSNSYCHSTVQNAADGTPTGVTYASPSWGATNVICGSCHRNMAVDAIGTGSHKLHAGVGNGQYPCATCHAGAGTGTTNHANGNIEMAFTTPPALSPPAAAGAIYSLGNVVGSGTSYAAATCSATTCHGAGTPRWGNNSATPTCDKCHTTAQALPFRNTGGVTSTADVTAGAHTMHLASAAATVPGGGAKTVISANLGCGDCHGPVATVNQAGHLDAVGGAEVAFGQLARTGGLTPAYVAATRSCANTYCHGAGLDRPASAVLNPAWNVPFMTGVAAGDCTRCHGYPPATAVHAGQTPATCLSCHPHVNASATGFTDPAKHVNGIIEATSGHAVPNYGHAAPPFTGCTGCHNASAAGIYPAVGGAAPNCRGCHLAANPTVTSSGCTSCHASPPNGTVRPNVAGSHARHAPLSGAPNNCAICHLGAGSGTGASHGPGNRGANPAVDDVVFTAAQAGAGALWNATAKSCASTYCHSSVQSATGSGAGVSITATWGGTALTCGGCHRNMAADATAPGSHVSHSQSSGTVYSCDICHGSGFAAATAAYPAHANQQINLSFTGNGTGTVYSKGNGFAPGSAVYGSCSAGRCHGSGQPVWGTPLWSTTDRCAKCHSSTAAGGVTAGNPFYSTSYPLRQTAQSNVKVGTHTSHGVGSHSLANTYACSVCHGTVTITGATHMNGATDFIWAALASTGGLTPSYTAATGTCANVYCHGARMPGGDVSGSNRAPVWNSTTYLPATLTAAACGTCHGFPPPTSAGHPAVTIPAGFPGTSAIGASCNCHANINPAGNSYATMFVNRALHVDGLLQVSGGHSVPYDNHRADIVAAGGNTACLGCHAMGTAASVYPAAVAGNAPDCMSCHKKAAPLHTGTTAGANCSSCHGLSTATGVRIGRPVGTAYPDRVGFHSGAQDGAHGTAACTVCHSGIGTSGGAGSGINHGRGATAGPVRNGKPNVVGPMVNGITPTNSAKGVGIPSGGTSCAHGTIGGSCSGGGTRNNSW